MALDERQLLQSIATALLAAVAFMLQAEGTPRSVFGAYWALGLLYLAGGRYVVSRYLPEKMRR